MTFPSEPYLYRGDAAHVGDDRPLSQGDVFVDIPLVAAAQPHDRHQGQWVAPTRTGDKALGLFVTHPCASRSSSTYKLAPVVSIAPVVRCPKGWGPPWDGYYDLCPLPALRKGQDYVAKLSEVCPVQSTALEGRRIACLDAEGLEALFHRLAMNSLRFPETPVHYKTQATKLTHEVDLWERWTKDRGTEDGFQQWLDEPFGGQPREGSQGEVIEGSAEPSAQSRRDVLLWNYDEVEAELVAFLAETR